MGIDGLCKVCNGDKEKGVPSLSYRIPLSDMNKKTIAVDGSANFFTLWNGICRRACDNSPNLLEQPLDMGRIASEWMGGVARRVRLWAGAGVNVVVVLDGTAPVQKEGTQAKRKQKTQEYFSRASNIVKTACEIAGVPYQPGSLYTGPLPEGLSFSQLKQIEALRETHRECLKNAINPIRDNWNELGLALSAEPDMRCVRSNVEAETLCCQMVLRGEADYVLSSDSDCLAYRVPVWLRDWELETSSFVAVNLVDVMDRLGLDSDQFLDFCIMSGCDYTIQKITQKKDGKKTIVFPLKRLKKHKSLEVVMKDKTIDWSVLNADFARTIFKLEIDVYPVPFTKEDVYD